MYPTYRDGAVVHVDTLAYQDPERLPSPGDVILARHPFRANVAFIKRVREITDDGRVFVVGDNLVESNDSRGFGALRPELVLGRVVD